MLTNILYSKPNICSSASADIVLYFNCLFIAYYTSLQIMIDIDTYA